MRKLASIQRVLALDPIKNADFIELAQINGWQCIVRKGEFKVGDLGVYLEIDAVPPNTPAFAFLWAPQPEPPANLRIRTKKLKGVVSQGLLMPLRGELADLVEQIPLEGDDWTELLGVKKYEIPVKGPRTHGKQVMYEPFAADIPKTDEERIQSSPGLLDELRGLPYVITEKCDGTSATFAIDRDGVFRVYSRNWEVEPARTLGKLETMFLATVRVVAGWLKPWPKYVHKLRMWVHERSHRRENLYWDIARKYNIEAALRTVTTCALQGEICGPGIQKNRLGLKENEFRAFTLYDKRIGERATFTQLAGFCHEFGIPPCKVVERDKSFAHTLPSLLKLAEGKYDGTANEREGIVVRPETHTHSRILGGALSFKVISNKFLLTGGEDE